MKKMFLSLILLSIFVIGCGYGYSEGTRVGVVTKFSKKGVIFKSWEGELLMALPAETSAINAEKWEFTVRPENTAIVADMQKAMRDGKRVELVYTEWFAAPPTIDTKFEISAVK